MQITYDPAKNAWNIAERGLSFDLAQEMDWDEALHVPDLRRDYGERRVYAIGAIRGEIYAVIYTDRANGRRIISLRRANARERRRYEQAP